jgi:hypothetical protein
VSVSKKWQCEPTWTGRSPVLATASVIAWRSAFSVISPSAIRYSPGIMRRCPADRLVRGDELGAVGEGRLDLDLVDHLGHSLHHLLAADDRGASRHQLGDAPAVARTLEHVVGDQRDRLRVVQPDAALEPPARDHCGDRHQQLVLLPRGEIHGACPPALAT